MALLAPDSADTLLNTVTARFGEGGLVHLERLASRPARYRDLARPLPEAIAARQAELGRQALWTHQATAIDHLRDRRSVVVATGTASGKSLCYQLPIAEAVSDPIRPGTALALFPTKALAQDQLRSFGDLATPALTVATYDGDTPDRQRAWARKNANVVLTNPEMLHCGILPHHGGWATFLMRLRYVVVDELHVLRGVFGTHVGHLLRRLQRLCAEYGSTPTFVFGSATIGHPERLAAELIGAPVQAVTDDGSPRGERLVGLIDPTLVDGPRQGRSAHQVTADLVADLVGSGHRTIGFCRSRAGTESIAADIVRRHRALAGRVRPYRGGYLPAERREIEAQFFSGRLGGVIATSALELGIDVGGLDACVLDGFPGTVASMWQQIGRTGRNGQPSLAVLVAGEDQLDRYFLAHPDELFSRQPEPAVINPANPQVLDPHLGCAAYEKPLGHRDERWWGEEHLADGVRRLVRDDRLRLRSTGDRARAVWAARGRPSTGMGLRSGSGREIVIAFADGTTIGTVDRARAPELVHPGAVYLHQARAHRVLDLDLSRHQAIVEPDDGRESTMARTDVTLRLLEVDQTELRGPLGLGLGTVEVSSRVTGYQVRDTLSGKRLRTEDLDMDPTVLVTRGYWWTIPETYLDACGIAPVDVPGTLHAIEHAAIGMLPLFTICDRWDVGGISTALLAETAAPTIVIYDGYPGGAGIAELGHRSADRQLRATLSVLERCGCVAGCPSCVQSPKCGNWNEPLDKAGARSVLRSVVGEI